MSDKKRYVTQSEILERGWTKGLMTRWLGVPDDMVVNPHHERGAPIQLFLLDRVLSCEFDKTWRLQMRKIEESRETRVKAAVKARETRMANVERRARQGVRTFGFGVKL